MLVDSDRRVIKLNKNAEAFAGANSEELVGLRGGDALRCLHSLDSPEGCGFGPYCKECTVRKTIIDTFETGTNHYNVEASLPFMVNSHVTYLTFLISTSFIDTEKDSKSLVSFMNITESKKKADELNKKKNTVA